MQFDYHITVTKLIPGKNPLYLRAHSTPSYTKALARFAQLAPLYPEAELWREIECYYNPNPTIALKRDRAALKAHWQTIDS